MQIKNAVALNLVLVSESILQYRSGDEKVLVRLAVPADGAYGSHGDQERLLFQTGDC
jgi:hypothetical protein